MDASLVIILFNVFVTLGQADIDITSASPSSLASVDESSAVAEESNSEEGDLDATDAHLAFHERRMRVRVCMELAGAHAKRNDREVKLYLQQMSDRLSEHDATNFLMHSLLVNCYHAIKQEEVENYGVVELEPSRISDLMARPKSKPRQKLSQSQLDVLNGLLREDGALGQEVQVLGQRFSELDGSMQTTLVVAAASIFVMPLVLLAISLLCPGCYPSCCPWCNLRDRKSNRALRRREKLKDASQTWSSSTSNTRQRRRK